MKKNNNLEKDTAKYRWIKAGLQILIIILLVTVTVILEKKAMAGTILLRTLPGREASRKVSEKKF